MLVVIAAAIRGYFLWSGFDTAIDFWGRVDVREGAADLKDKGEARGSFNARERRKEGGCRPLLFSPNDPSRATKDADDDEDWLA